MRSLNVFHSPVFAVFSLAEIYNLQCLDDIFLTVYVIHRTLRICDTHSILLGLFSEISEIKNNRLNLVSLQVNNVANSVEYYL